MNKQRLQRLLSPHSIAVFGSRGADFAIRESQKMGFLGTIYAVHPTRVSLAELPCFTSAKALPEVPDAAYVAVNSEAAITIVAHLNAMGCGGAVLYASGFSEVGAAGAERQQRLVEAAGDMPIIGPNCYGIINALDKAVLWPDQHGLSIIEQGVAIITQSGNIGLNMTMQKVGLPIAYMVTMGNQAQADIATIVDAMLDDPRVTAIGLHIEGIHDLALFDRVARQALQKKIPIVALKSGRTEAAAQIALSHTSSLTGADQLFDAFFARLGIARVNTVPEFLETLKLLSLLGTLPTNGIASLSCSGGEAGMMADLIDQTPLCFPSLTEAHQQQVRQTLNEYVDVANPLDYHTFIWGDFAAMAATFTAMLQGTFSASVLLLDWPNYLGADPLEWDTALLAFAKATKANQHSGIILASMAECLPDHAIALCHQHQLTPMIGLDTCLKALSHAHKIYQAQQSNLPAPIAVYQPDTHQGTPLAMNEYDAKQALATFGLVIPQGTLASSVQEAITAAATAIGYPVTIKAIGNDLLHKTELGAVKLNLQTPTEVTTACQHLLTLSDTLLVEAMQTDVLAELIIGVNNDALFGNYVVIGTGGIFVELLKDSQPLLLPCSREDILQALQTLAILPLLNGFRSQPKADLQTIVDAVMAVIGYIETHPVLEMDINPLLVQANGCIAVDALIR